MLCRDIVPGNVSDVNHSVVISGEDTLVNITFQVSQFVPHALYAYAWLHVKLYKLATVLHELLCNSTRGSFPCMKPF